jgi:hypothetical protein
MPTLKGFECRVDGFDDPAYIVAPTASKARASYWRDLRDCCPDITMMEIKVRRAPAHDMTFPDLPAEASDLNSREREIIVHTFGGGGHIRPEQWGYRDHYCGDPSDPILNGLVARGLMSGPHGVDKAGDTGMWVGAFFCLTDKGKTVARALIGQREAA